MDAGDPAPDGQLTTVSGAATSLSQFWTERPLVLVFLRHLGCLFCREQVARLRTDYPLFQKAGAEIVCIAQGDARVGKAFSILMDLPFPILMCGNDLSIYRKYGLTRGTLWQLFGPGSIVQGLRALVRGHKQGAIVGDGFQMPGVFIVDRSGTIRYARRHVHAGDNPRSVELLDALASLP